MGQLHGSGLGNWANVAQVTDTNRLLTRGTFDNTITDSFERLKVVTPFTISDNIFKYDKDPLRWDTISLGSAGTSHLPDESAVNLTCGSADGDKVIFSQRRFNRYQAGRGFSLIMTGVIGSPMNGIIRRWGLFDENDGLFFELSGTSWGVVRRTSVTGTPVDNRTEQADFNHDQLNGSGASNFNIDVTKNNIYNIEFQWLSAGRVNYFVESDDDDIGKVLMHAEENVNTLTTPFMKTADLPVRYEQESVDDETGREQAEFKAICSTVIIEGGQDPPEETFGAASPTEQGVDTTEEHVLTIRPSGTFNAITNRMVIIPRLFTASTETKQATFRAYLNANVSGTFSQVDSNSSVEFSAGSAAFGGGVPIAVFSIGKDSGEIIDLSHLAGMDRVALTVNASGNSADKLTITAQSSTATANVIAGLTWGEIR